MPTIITHIGCSRDTLKHLEARYSPQARVLCPGKKMTSLRKNKKFLPKQKQLQKYLRALQSGGKPTKTQPHRDYPAFVPFQ